MVDITYERVPGDRCCCGDDSCEGNREDQWLWVARDDEFPGREVATDNPDRSRMILEGMQGRTPLEHAKWVRDLYKGEGNSDDGRTIPDL